MKGNIKKLAVFVVIVTVATFISASMVSAGGKNKWRAIHGEYAATSVAICNGYDADGMFTSTNTDTELATYTFNGDGTGTVVGKMVMVGITPPEARGEFSFDMSWDFTYEVADDGKITMYLIPETSEFKIGTFVVWTYTSFSPESGRFSVDHKTIAIASEEVHNTVLTLSGNRVRNTKCAISRVLIRVGKGGDEDE